MTKMTEDQVERRVERMVDLLDAAFMRGDFTQEEYDARMKAVDEWAEARLSEILPRYAGRGR